MRDGQSWPETPAVLVSGDASVLAQIAADVRSLNSGLAAIVDRLTRLETLLGELRHDAHDHEQRLRALESTRPALLPRIDYERDRDARGRRFGWVTALVVTSLVAIVVPLEAVWLSRVFG